MSPDSLVLETPVSQAEPNRPPPPGPLRALWVELRPTQWVKNFFVLAPLFFSPHVFSLDALLRSLAACGCFCLASSSIYLLNDLTDCAQDRLHPEKRRRPLAAGLLRVGIARAAVVGLLLLSLLGGAALSVSLALVLSTYWGLNLLYAWRLKHAVILDVFVVAAGYLLRVLAGAVVLQVTMSAWVLICTTLLALFIALCKRRHELVLLEDGAPNHRQVLTDYPLPFLDAMVGIITASALVSYTLYTVSEEIVGRFGSPGLLLTVPFVLYGFFRYLYLVYHKEEGGDPTQSILTDRPMMVNLLLWVATAGVILYGERMR
ncbi:MAG: decaprenyl-phosphate phosphoribosyltransferase [Candidatus Omnitrophica bacterium]|nr:decaprenyl-phosphate phosphoribosyltransferase [Candidatus Omnitrophota bacterium]